MKNASINIKIFILFIIILLGTIIGTGYIPYSNWSNLVDQTTEKAAKNLNDQIIDEIDVFVRDAKHLVRMNKGILERGIIDIHNEAVREQFFTNALSGFDSEGIYSFSYGTESGEYYGARKNEKNVIEMMKNNEETYGRSWYYSVDDGKAGELVLDVGEFDPRTRDWYKAAKQKNQVIFSPIYKHFVLDDLVVSLSVPIYSDGEKIQGVLGSHMNLSRFGSFLEALTSENNACAFIIEKESSNIVANCSNDGHFKRRENGELERLSINEIGSKLIPETYYQYLDTGINTYKMDGKNGQTNIKITEYNDQGLEWLIITSLPESPMIATIKDSMRFALLLTILIILISSYIFYRSMKRYMGPINSLIQTQEDFANGDLLKREKIIRSDEIGMVASSFNDMADMIYDLINNLEKQVKERTQELNESKEHFEKTLLSVGDGIIATDDQGVITVMNPVIEELTGWSNEIKHGKPFDEVLTIISKGAEKKYENPIKEVLASGEIIETSGQPIVISRHKELIPVEYTAAPIKNKEAKTTGVVVVLRDISVEKERVKQIKYLSMHDQLTGLYNRWHMEEELIRLDKEEYLPLTVMVVDVNGLKLVNDAFGHEMGDRLLQVVGKSLKSAVRADDVVGRVGGDEFLILLPKTDQNGTERVRERILNTISLQRVESVVISIAIGYTVKENIDEDIENIRISADNQMYKNKLIHGKTMRNETIETVLRNINFKYDQEQIHTERVSQYCESIARAMGFSENETKDIKTAGVLHDIGKIAVPPEILNKSEKLTEEEIQLIKMHPETGYHILKSVDEYIGIAEDVLCHHESWDGTGYPQGLKGEQIPLNARIITVADAYEAMTAQRAYQETKNKEEAIAELKRCAGSQFDPEIVKVFIEEVLR